MTKLFRTAVIVLMLLLFSSISASADTQVITLDMGDGTVAVSEKLEDAGLIEHPLLFRLYCTLLGRNGGWQYGTHELPEDPGYAEMVKSLQEPTQRPIKLTIPEGLQVTQIAERLEGAGVCKSGDFMAACTECDFSDYPFLKDVNTGERKNGLEGYLFPDTYFFDEDMDPEAAVRIFLDGFAARVYDEDFLSGCSSVGFSPDEVIILASIVESEAQTEDDRRNVADVFIKRLREPEWGYLQSCVTVEYAKGIKKQVISIEDTEYDSPYNTYRNAGLPLGPICCPGRQSIDAVLHRNKNNYYYFVSDLKCRLWFAATLKEHVRNSEAIYG